MYSQKDLVGAQHKSPQEGRLSHVKEKRSELGNHPVSSMFGIIGRTQSRVSC